jgi:hypothetical protein
METNKIKGKAVRRTGFLWAFKSKGWRWNLFRYWEKIRARGFVRARRRQTGLRSDL